MNSIDNQYQKRAAGAGSQTANLSGGNTAGGRTARRGKGRSEGRITDRLFTIILVSVMLAGIGLLAYPSLADYWNSFHQSRAVMSYAEHVSDMNAEEYDRLLSEAKAYNERFVENGLNWHLTEEEKAEYESVLDVDGSGVMGYIRIPKIDVMLPVYHGTAESVLQTSIGHLEGSSLPVGGENTHCLLSGHRGLPSARLFTDLDQLREGDTFTITVLNDTLTYEVDHIWIVEPEDLSHLTIEAGQDLCTLITCTPYGINTHRLLVRGHRIPNVDGGAMVVADAIQIRPVFIAPFLAIPILVLLLIWMLISTSMNRRKVRDRKAEYLSEHHLAEPELEIEDKDLVIDAVRAFMEKRRRR